MTKQLVVSDISPIYIRKLRNLSTTIFAD